MVVPTGTASPWLVVDGGGHAASHTLVCPVDDVRSGADLLGEALRIEGICRSVGPALVAAEEAELSVGWFGWVDGEDSPELCSEDGYTAWGDEVEMVVACAIARVVVHSWMT